MSSGGLLFARKDSTDMKSNVKAARKHSEHKWTSNVAILCGAAILLTTGGTEIYNYLQRRAAEANFGAQMQ